jgi:hypothetical protein
MRQTLWGAAIMLTATASVLHGWSQDATPLAQPQAKETSGQGIQFYGVNTCRRCHREPDSKDIVVCSCTEVPRWEQEDKHRRSFDLLKDERGKRMGQLLGGEPDVTKRRECLACHAVDVDAKDKVLPTFALEEGVSCGVCHGFRYDWVPIHGDPNQYLNKDDKLNWRKKSREQKDRDFGMVDLWDPARRTGLCVSCHVGNAAQGKFVSHDMYAAGHPPLPGIEVASFSNQMPRHWEYLRQKEARWKKLPPETPGLQELLRAYAPRELEETKLVLIAGLVAFRESMALLAAEARKCQEKNEVLDLAHFDCYACHHDLKPQSWRQKNYAGKPGRPQPRPWPTALVRLSLRQLAGKDDGRYQTLSSDFHKGLTELTRAFDKQPFGDNQAIAAAAGQLVKWSDEQLREVSTSRCDAAAARRLLQELTSVPPDSRIDYDTARQIAWALKTMADELEAVGQPLNKDAAGVFKTIEENLRLKLPAGQAGSIEKDLPDSLRHVNQFDPEPFQKSLRQLGELIAG